MATTSAPTPETPAAATVPAPSGSERAASKLTDSATVIAAFVVLAWVVMLFWLLADTSTSETIWARKHIVLSSMEAVAFAAAGALFGTTIQQRRVQDAKDETRQARTEKSQAEQDAKANADAASKGHALASAVKEAARMADRTRPLANERGLAAEAQPLNDAAGLQQLGGLAERLFPH